MKNLLLVAAILACPSSPVYAGPEAASSRQTDTPATIVLLPVQHIDQDVDLCVPTCASMSVAYYGDPHDQHEIKALSLPPDNHFFGTHFSDLVKGMAELGYHWRIGSYNRTLDGYTHGLKDIIASIRQQQPVLVDLPEHVVLVVGFDLNAQELAFQDPARPAPGFRVMTFAQFQSTWHEDSRDTQVDHAQSWAIFTSPKIQDKTPAPLPEQPKISRKPLSDLHLRPGEIALRGTVTDASTEHEVAVDVTETLRGDTDLKLSPPQAQSVRFDDDTKIVNEAGMKLHAVKPGDTVDIVATRSLLSKGLWARAIAISAPAAPLK